MAFESAISSPEYTALDAKPLSPTSSPKGNRSPLLSSAATPTFANTSAGAIVLSSDDKDGNNPFADPFPHKDEIDKASVTVAHSHHFATAYLTGTTTSSPATHPAPAYDPAIEEVHFAAERLALALEDAASRQPEGRAKRALLKRARKVREKIGSLDTDSRSGGSCHSEDDVKGKKVAKIVGGGLLLLCTTPVYLSGAIIEGTGLMLKASGMVLKGTGKGLKKLHTMTVEKLDLKI